MILKEEVSLDQIWTDYNHYYDDMVKFCVDIKHRIVAIDGDMHIDLENELYDNGSEFCDIFGGNILKDPIEIIWEAHPNIERNRSLGIGQGRELTDPDIIDELSGILYEWIK